MLWFWILSVQPNTPSFTLIIGKYNWLCLDFGWGIWIEIGPSESLSIWYHHHQMLYPIFIYIAWIGSLISTFVLDPMDAIGSLLLNLINLWFSGNFSLMCLELKHNLLEIWNGDFLTLAIYMHLTIFQFRYLHAFNFMCDWGSWCFWFMLITIVLVSF